MTAPASLVHRRTACITLVGLPVTSHDNATLATAAFEGLEVTP
jgi:hypothetical protein